MALALRPAVYWHGRRASFAIVDQAFLSATNLALTVIVANAISIDAFGIYGTVWAVSIFIDGVATSTISEPLPALMRRFTGYTRRRLIAAAFWASVLLGLATSGVLLSLALLLVLWSPEIALLAATFALVNLFQRIQSVSRRLCYLEGRQPIPALISAGTFLVTVGLALTLSATGHLGVVSSILLWAVGGFLFLLAAAVRPSLRVGFVPPKWLKWFVQESWKAGRWLLAASAAFWVDSLSMLPLATFIAGPAGTGILRALQVLVSPVVQFNGAILMTFVPKLAELSRMTGSHQFRNAGVLGTGAMVCVALIYSTVLIVFAPLIIQTVYRNKEILDAAWLLWPLLIGLVIDTLGQGLRAMLLATGRTRAIFVARIAGVPVFAISSLLLVPSHAVAGLVWASVGSSAAITGTLLVAVSMTHFRPVPADFGKPDRAETVRDSIDGGTGI